MRYFVIFAMLLGLSACGDPLKGIETIQSDDAAPDEPIAQALSDASEVGAEDGFFARVLRPKSQADDLTDTGSAESLLPASDQTDADQSTGVDAALAEANSAEPQEPSKGGVLDWLRRSAKNAKEETNESASEDVALKTAADPLDVATASVDVDISASVPADVSADVDVVQAENALSDTAEPAEIPVATVEPAKRKGLFGIFKPVKEAPETVQVASLSSDPVAPESEALQSPDPLPSAAVEPAKRRGLFGNAAKSRKSPRNGPDARDVEYGEILPYGEVARVCSAQNRPLGRKVDKAPARGRGYSLYDSAPNSEAQRTFYITGFSDGCPRQFTAALALLGAPTLHEQLRYGKPSSEYPYSTTDKAYEKVKSAVCGVGKRKPCGAKIGLLEKNTVFVSTYERFGNNARWADILIHDGAVLAAAIKKP